MLLAPPPTARNGVFVFHKSTVHGRPRCAPTAYSTSVGMTSRHTTPIWRSNSNKAASRRFCVGPNSLGDSDTEEAPQSISNSTSSTGISGEAASSSAESGEIDGEALMKVLEAFKANQQAQQRQLQQQAVPTTCLNCTAKVVLGSNCRFCGHHTDDDELLTARCSVLEVPGVSSVDSEVLLAWDPRFDMHAAPRPPVAEGGLVAVREFLHPERPERTSSIIHRMQQSGVAGLCRFMACREAEMSELSSVHDPSYLSSLQHASEVAKEKGKPLLVGDHAFIGEHSWEVFRLSAGTAAEMATQLVKGEAKSGVATIRPPGHLASSNAAQGFCFINNVAVAACAARNAGAERVAIVDWGVHHGRGTQEIFNKDPSVLTISLHRHEKGECFPGTGAAEEIGEGEGSGYSINVPFDTHGVSDGDYLAAFRHCVLPVLQQYQPQLVIISAGFDSAEDDHLGFMAVTPQGYATMMRSVAEVAPTMLLLEGGYNLEITAECFEACAITLLDPSMAPPLSEDPSEGPQPTYSGLSAVAKTLTAVSQYWPSVPAPSLDELMVSYSCFGAVEMLERVLAARNSTVLATHPGADGADVDVDVDVSAVLL